MKHHLGYGIIRVVIAVEGPTFAQFDRRLYATHYDASRALKNAPTIDQYEIVPIYFDDPADT